MANEKLQGLIEEFNRRNARRSKIMNFGGIVAVCAAVLVSVALMYPALTATYSDINNLDGSGSVGESTLVCSLPEHTHDASCVSEVVMCDLPEGNVHVHVPSCYNNKGVLICGNSIAGHAHLDWCYNSAGVLICDIPENAHMHTAACYNASGKLTCSSNLPHIHGEGCYQKTESSEPAEDGTVDYTYKLVCGKQSYGHIHNAACYDKSENLICGQTEKASVPHTHSKAQGCYSEEIACGLEEHIHTADCYAKVQADEVSESNDEPKSSGASDSEKSSRTAGRSGATYSVEGGSLSVSLLYGDQASHPDGVSSYTCDNMMGFIKLEPSNLTEDLTDVTVTLAIPKKYVEKDSIKIPEFITNSNITKYTIPAVTEDDENYYACIDFSLYDKTLTLQFPFTLSFKDNVVPDNYELPIAATVTREESDSTTTTLSKSNELIYKPKYKDWSIDKFVNTNKLEAFKEDGAHVVVTAQDETGNPYLDDMTYANFAFRVNSVTSTHADLKNYRDASQVTLTDTLPIYVDKDGNTRTAVFDQNVNPGWALSDDGKTVFKTYYGADSTDILRQIYEDAMLKLRFPDLKFEGENGILSASLDNEVKLTAVPSNEVEGETHPTAEDSLKFVMTTEAGTKGSLSKQAIKGKIYDTDDYKTNPYPWKIRLSNDGVTPLEHIKIQDRRIEENGKVVLTGPDEALKFVKLESNLSESVPNTGRTFGDMVEKVVAYYTDGQTRDCPITVNEAGNFAIEFDKNKVCSGYEIVFKDDFQLLTLESVSFMAYTVYRDPQNTHVPEGVESVRYDNTARSVNTYMQGNKPVDSFLYVTHGYDMLPITEHLEIGKQTYANSATENNMAGDKYRYWISIGGSLSDAKEYEKIYIVDLLPNEVDFTKVTHGSELFTGGGSRYPGITTGVSATPRIEENYHNSGRTALIWELPYETLLAHLNSKENGLYYVVFQIEVQIRADARPGTTTNHIYIVGDNLEEYTGKTGGTADVYDLNNNGRTDDMIACSSSNAVVIASSSIYAEKFIAPADSTSWNKQGLKLKAGTDFDYKLKVTNDLDDQSGLVVYDTLPAIGDKGIFGNSSPRNSDFHIKLRESIVPPAGYKVYYTSSADVYSHDMKEMISADIWNTSDWETATAFKLVANDGVGLTKDGGPFEVVIPACAPDSLSDESLKILENKINDAGQGSSTEVYLQAINNFGFLTDQAIQPKESNSVWARIPFANLTIKKVDSETNESLTGAEFTLHNADGKLMPGNVVDENGVLTFYGLTEGTYTLTEVKAPAGYVITGIPLTVTITQNPITMEYKVECDGEIECAGSSSDPLVIGNSKNFELPGTGGFGNALYVMGGFLLLVVSLLFSHIRKRRLKNIGL